MSKTLTADEIAFFARAVPYIEQGMSMEDALRTVLARDQELASIALSDAGIGRATRAGLAAQTYHAIRGRKAVADAVDREADACARGTINWR